MATNSLLFPIKKDSKTIHHDVIVNIIKMFVERKWINKDSEENIISTLLTEQNDNELYTIPLDNILVNNEDIQNFDGSKVILKILHQKISGLNKTPILTDFIESFNTKHRIVIVDSISDKPQSQLQQLSHVEVFVESFFLINLLEHECSPKYEILTSEQKTEVMNSYQLTKKQMKKMFDSDAVSKYLYLKSGQIVRIIRNNVLSAHAIDYRIVIHKQISTK